MKTNIYLALIALLLCVLGNVNLLAQAELHHDYGLLVGTSSTANIKDHGLRIGQVGQLFDIDVNGSGQLQFYPDGGTTASFTLDDEGGGILARTDIARTDFTFGHSLGSPSSSNSGFTIENSEGGNRHRWNLYVQNADGNLLLYFNEAAFRGEFDNASGAYSSVSDGRLKTDIIPFEIDLEKLDELEPVTYTFREDPDKSEYIGFIAQEVEKVFPQLVSKTTVGDTAEEINLLDYSGFGIIAISAIKHLRDELSLELENSQLLQNQITDQQRQIEELRAKVRDFIAGK